MNLVIELSRDSSAGAYLLRRRSELPLDEHADAVLAGIDAAIGLETSDFGRARRSWRTVVDILESLGRAARSSGKTPRRLLARIGQVRDAVDLVLFDGHLPPDLAATAARMAAKMFSRASERALHAYWSERSTNGRS